MSRAGAGRVNNSARIPSAAERMARKAARRGRSRESAGAAERARRVMEELRRRLADPARPVDERDYLERLMKRD